MSVCTYIASNVPLQEDPILWKLSRGGEDILTDMRFVAQVDPGLEDMMPVLTYIFDHMKTAGEMEIWHIWQGIDCKPVIRDRRISAKELTVGDIMELAGSNVFETIQYGIPVQHRIPVV